MSCDKNELLVLFHHEFENEKCWGQSALQKAEYWVVLNFNS